MDQCKRNCLTIDGHQLAITLNENFKTKSVLTVNALGCRMWKRMEVTGGDDNSAVSLAASSDDGGEQRQQRSTRQRKAKAKYLKKRKVCERKVLRVPCATYPRYTRLHVPLYTRRVAQFCSNII
jgi:hypothetical protein